MIIRALIFVAVAIFVVMWVRTVIEVFRRKDLSSAAKGAWAIFMLVIPFIGLLIYTLLRPAASQGSRRR